MKFSPRTNPYVRVSPGGWVALIVTSLFAAVSANPWLTLVSLWVVPLFLILLWRRYEPPILLFAIVVQWAEVAAKVFHADILDVPVTAMFGHPIVVEAILRGLVGLVVMAVGMRVALISLPSQPPERLWHEGREISTRQTWQLYLVTFLLDLTTKGIVYQFPSLTQILLPLFNVKWVVFFLLAYSVFLKQRDQALLCIAVALEVIVGFSGFFSGFKQVFFVLAVAYMSLGIPLRGRRLAFISGIAVMVFSLGVVWMTVRQDYRHFVNKGTGMQVVKVEFESRLSKLGTLISDSNSSDFVEGVEKLAKRIAYVDMFAHVLRRVPKTIPYEDGKLWVHAIRHILMPRILFPEKKRLWSDSELTMYYTGQSLSSDAHGTSISMGYLAESYIDFGPLFMYLPIFVLGAMWGGMYRYFITRGSPTLLGYAVAVVVLINADQFEMTSTKLIGSMLMNFIVMALLLKIGLPQMRGWVFETKPTAT